MNEKDIKQLITQGESQTVEFKSSLKLMNEIGETISTLTNTSGGIILIGVLEREEEI